MKPLKRSLGYDSAAPVRIVRQWGCQTRHWGLWDRTYAENGPRIILPENETLNWMSHLMH